MKGPLSLLILILISSFLAWANPELPIQTGYVTGWIENVHPFGIKTPPAIRRYTSQIPYPLFKLLRNPLKPYLFESKEFSWKDSDIYAVFLAPSKIQKKFSIPTPYSYLVQTGPDTFAYEFYINETLKEDEILHTLLELQKKLTPSHPRRHQKLKTTNEILDELLSHPDPLSILNETIKEEILEDILPKLYLLLSSPLLEDRRKSALLLLELLAAQGSPEFFLLVDRLLETPTLYGFWNVDLFYFSLEQILHRHASRFTQTDLLMLTAHVERLYSKSPSLSRISIGDFILTHLQYLSSLQSIRIVFKDPELSRQQKNYFMYLLIMKINRSLEELHPPLLYESATLLEEFSTYIPDSSPLMIQEASSNLKNGFDLRKTQKNLGHLLMNFDFNDDR